MGIDFKLTSSVYSLSLCFRVSALTLPHTQNSLTHYTRSTWLPFLLAPNGDQLSSFLEIPSRYSSLSITFVFQSLSRRFSSLPSRSRVWIYSGKEIQESFCTGGIEFSSWFLIKKLTLFLPVWFSQVYPASLTPVSQFRSPLLSGSLLISHTRY